MDSTTLKFYKESVISIQDFIILPILISSIEKLSAINSMERKPINITNALEIFKIK